MTIEEAILEKVRMLPPEKQHEVLDFTERLQSRTPANEPRKPLRGSGRNWASRLPKKTSPKRGGRMWGSFPREAV
jgi:hypothetical protein